MEEIEQLFSTCRNGLVAFSSSITKNKEDAREVVQDVFLECLQTDAALITRPYLFKSVRNRSYNRLRSQKRFLNVVENFTEYMKNCLFPAGQGSDVNVQDMLCTLPPAEKEVVLLRIKEELKISEIAEILNIPEGTVKSRLNRALGVLRQKQNVARSLE